MPFHPGFKGALRKLEGIFVDNDVQNNASGQQNWTFNGVNFGTASADRYLVVCINTANNASVTIGGVTAAAVGSLSTIYIAHVPSGPSGTVQINKNDAFGTSVSFGLYAITGPLNTTVFDTQATTGSGGTAISIDVSGGGIVIGNASGSGASTNPTCSWSVLTENYDMPRIVGGAQGFGHSGAFSEFIGPQTVSGSTSWSNGNQTFMQIASFAPI